MKTPKGECSRSVSVFLCAVWVVGYFYIDCTLFQEGLKMNNNDTLQEIFWSLQNNSSWFDEASTI